jgi:predicted transcriptional regulator
VTHLLADYILAASAAVIVASAVILASLLARYNRLVQEADKSARLAKDVWDSMNSRFSMVDGRIIDLMAKSDVLSSRLGLSPAVVSQPRSVSTSAVVQDNKSSRPLQSIRSAEPVLVGEGTETETKVLRLLAEGPKSSAEIKEWIGRSREHTARLMKALFDRGLVVRNDRNKPYVYEITESGRSYVAS